MEYKELRQIDVSKYTEKKFIPRLQMITESSKDGTGTRLLYVDSEKDNDNDPWINIKGPNRGVRRIKI